MTEEFNPYNNQNENVQPQPLFNQQTSEQPVQPQMPAQPPVQPVQQQSQPPVQNRYPYPQQYTNAQRTAYPYRDNKKTSGAAKAFGVVSFIIGCFALIITSMIYFNFRSTVSEKYGFSLAWSAIIGLPALIFGVVSLMKKTDKKIFPILGIAFAVILMLCTFITYFFMVNAVNPGSVGHVYY